MLVMLPPATLPSLTFSLVPPSPLTTHTHTHTRTLTHTLTHTHLRSHERQRFCFNLLLLHHRCDQSCTAHCDCDARQAGWKGKTVTLVIDAALSTTTWYLNGKRILVQNPVGYLPTVLVLAVNPGQPNLLAAYVDGEGPCMSVPGGNDRCPVSLHDMNSECQNMQCLADQAFDSSTRSPPTLRTSSLSSLSPSLSSLFLFCPTLPLSPSLSAAHRTAQGGLTTGWWYEGSGLIRSARLVATSAEAAVEPFGLSSPAFFKGDATPHTAGKTSAGLFAGSAVMSPTATLVGTGIDGAGIKVNFDLVDATGAKVASALVSPVAGVAEAVLTVTPLVELWSVPRPYLYALEVTVFGAGGDVLDTTSVATGIRNLNWDAELGLKVNEERVKMRGACNHESFTGVCL